MPSFRQEIAAGGVPVDIVGAASLAAGETWFFQPSEVMRLGEDATNLAESISVHPAHGFTITLPNTSVYVWSPNARAFSLVGLRLVNEPGPLRNRTTLAAGNAYENDAGVIVQAAAAGAVTYRTLDGTADATQTLAAGDVISVGTVPVLVRAIRDSTAANVVLGHI